MRDAGGETTEQDKMLDTLGFAFQTLPLQHFPLEGHRLAVQLCEHTDFCPQELGNDRSREVVYRSMFVSLELIAMRQALGRDEDDRRLPVAGVLADELCECKAIEF